jgi:ubiquinone/menaquinone biosynthesis C-methylase UbiE
MIEASPFFSRLQRWPRGYPGDFETIQYLLCAENLAPRGTAAFHLEQYGLTCPAAQQHRNKVLRQAELARNLLRDGNVSAPSILSLACGSSPDLAHVRDYLRQDVCVTLVDSDADALELSRQALTDVPVQCRLVHGNVLRLKRLLPDTQPAHLILIGGLFDYLRDSTIQRFLKLLWNEFLAPGGRLFFTNISPDNPDRLLIEYFGDWVLTARDEAALSRLCDLAGLDGCHRHLQRDATGCTILVELQRTQS